MPPGAAHPVRELREAILRYLQEHPEAADTLVGIHQWWLPESLRSTSIDLIGLALAQMVIIGEIRCDTLSNGTRLYSRAEDEPPSGSNGERR